MRRRVRWIGGCSSPEEWDDDSEFNHERRQRAHLPDDVHHVEKWRLALQTIDELRSWGIEPPVILGDGAYGDNTEFRTGLEDRELKYVLDVKGLTSAYRADVRPRATAPAWAPAGSDPRAWRLDGLAPTRRAASCRRRPACRTRGRDGPSPCAAT